MCSDTQRIMTFSTTRLEAQKLDVVPNETRMSLKRTEFWPDPDSSRGRPLTPLRNKFGLSLLSLRCWEALSTGSAFKKYLEIKPHFKAVLENHPELISGPAAKLTCCMAGRIESQIRPVIILHCCEKNFCKKVDYNVRLTEEWKKWKHENPLFSLMTADRAPSLLAPISSHHEDIIVCTDEPRPQLFGTSIHFKSGDESKPVENSASLGGVVLLNGKPHGLTVSHVFQPRESVKWPRNNLDPDFVDIFSVSGNELDELWSVKEDLCADDISSEARRAPMLALRFTRPLTNTLVEDYHFMNSPTRENYESDSDFELESSVFPRTTLEVAEQYSSTRSIGRITLKSGDEHSIGYDWAICELTEDIIQDLNGSSTINCIAGISLPQDKDLYVNFAADELLIEEENILVVMPPGKLVKGILSATPSLFRPDGQKTFVEVFFLRLEEALSMGHCGSWVIGAQSGRWFGHIIAEEPGMPGAYLIPASSIQKDIWRVNQSTLTLPIPFENMNHSSRTSIVERNISVPQSSSLSSSLNNFTVDNDIQTRLDERGRYLEQLMIQMTWYPSSVNSDVLTILNDRNDRFTIGEETVRLAAAAPFQGRQVVSLVLERTSHTLITKNVLTSIGNNVLWGEDVFDLILNFVPHVKISDSLLECVAGVGINSTKMFARLVQRLPHIRVSEAVLSAAARNTKDSRIFHLVLIHDKTAMITETVLQAAMSSNQTPKEVELLLSRRLSNFQASEETLLATAKNLTGDEVLVKLLGQTLNLRVSEQVLIEIIRSSRSAFRLILDRDPNIKISEQVLIALAETKWNQEAFNSFLYQNPNIEISEQLVVAVAGNIQGQKALTKLLNWDPSIEISETILIAVARNYQNRECFEMLLDRFSSIKYLEQVLIAAANNKRSPEAFKILFSRYPSTKISESVLIAAAESQQGVEVFKILVVQDPNIQISDQVLIAAVKTDKHGVLLRMLFDLSPEIEISDHALITAIRECPRDGTALNILLDRDRNIDLSEQVLIEAVKSYEVEALRIILTSEKIVKVSEEVLIETIIGVNSEKTMRMLLDRNPSAEISDRVLEAAIQKYIGETALRTMLDGRDPRIETWEQVIHIAAKAFRGTQVFSMLSTHIRSQIRRL